MMKWVQETVAINKYQFDNEIVHRIQTDSSKVIKIDTLVDPNEPCWKCSIKV